MFSADAALPRDLRQGVVSTADRVRIRVHVWSAAQLVPGVGILKEGLHEVVVPEDKLPLIRQLVETGHDDLWAQAEQQYKIDVARKAANAVEMTAGELAALPLEAWPDRAKNVEATYGESTVHGHFWRLATARHIGRNQAHLPLLPTAQAPELLEVIEAGIAPELPREQAMMAAYQRAAGIGESNVTAALEARVEQLQYQIEALTSAGTSSSKRKG